MAIVVTNDGPKLRVQGTRILQENLESRHQVVVNRGGTRSSKTRSLIDLFIGRFFMCQRRRTLIARDTFPALRRSAMFEFIERLKDENLYQWVDHNKAEHTLRYRDNEIVFASIDDPQKVRGAPWNDAWFNEGNEVEYEGYWQVSLRQTRPTTNGLPNQIFIDFNPDSDQVWIKKELEDRGRCHVIKSSYLDNPFLTPEDIAKIEYLREHDENFWTVYGLGEYGQRVKGLVYPTWSSYTEDPPEEPIYGLDFGFNKPTALTENRRTGMDLYFKQLIYRTELTDIELIALMKEVIPNPRSLIYCDSSDAKAIRTLHLAGFNVHPADKSAGSVLAGIRYMKMFNLHIHADSTDLQDEARHYKWKADKDGQPMDEPLKFKDHLWDASRYAVFTHGMKYWNIGRAEIVIPKARPRNRPNGRQKGYW